MGVFDEVAVRLVSLPTDPTDQPAGTLYFNTETGRVRLFTGTAWVDVDD